MPWCCQQSCIVYDVLHEYLQCIHDCLLFNVKTLKAVIRLDTVCYVRYVYTWGLYKNAEPSLFVCIIICTRGKLSREKAFMNFAVLWILAKVFSVKFGSVASLGMAKVSNLQKFSPLKVSHYM